MELSHSDAQTLVGELAAMVGGDNGTNRTTGTVTKVDKDGTIWVKLAGSDTETPCERTSSAVELDDVVAVTISKGRGTVDANYTRPSTDDEKAIRAEKTANRAREASDKAIEYAQSAEASAEAASASATEAKSAAARASTAADSALVQLSVVEDVAGTLEWISDHGTFSQTQDAEIVEGKVYFTYDSETGDYTPVAEPKAEQLSSYYELSISDSQTEYIMAHLAVTSRGLWVLPSGKGSGTTPASGESQDDSDARQGSGYKALLSSDGMTVFDGDGNEVAKFGESVEFSSSRPQHIGGEDAYITYYDSDNDGIADSIDIGGNVTIGDSRTLSELLAALDEPQYDHTFTKSNGTYAFTAKVYKHGEDVTSLYDPDFFVWYLRTEANGDVLLGRGLTQTVTESQIGYHGTVLGGLEDVLEAALVDDSDATMQFSDGSDVAVNVIWEV